MQQFFAQDLVVVHVSVDFGLLSKDFSAGVGFHIFESIKQLCSFSFFPLLERFLFLHLAHRQLTGLSQSPFFCPKLGFYHSVSFGFGYHNLSVEFGFLVGGWFLLLFMRCIFKIFIYSLRYHNRMLFFLRRRHISCRPLWTCSWTEKFLGQTYFSIRLIKLLLNPVGHLRYLALKLFFKH